MNLNSKKLFSFSAWICDLCFFSSVYSVLFSGQSIIDSRCYLDGGGSAESLTASEDLSVGSVIGKYRTDEIK